MVFEREKTPIGTHWRVFHFNVRGGRVEFCLPQSTAFRLGQSNCCTASCFRRTPRTHSLKSAHVRWSFRPSFLLSSLQLILDLCTGKAKGSVTILLSREGRLVPPGVEGETAAAINENPEAASAVGEAANGEENDGISLLIAFTPEWTARFNRPVLPLETLPSPVGIGGPPAKHIPAHGESGGEVCRLLEMTGSGEAPPRGATF